MKTKITKLEIITEQVGPKQRRIVKGTLDIPNPNNPEHPSVVYYTSDEMVELCEKHATDGIVDLKEFEKEFEDNTLEVENYTFNFPEYPRPITVTILQYQDMETGEWCPMEEPEYVARLVLKQLKQKEAQ